MIHAMELELSLLLRITERAALSPKYRLTVWVSGPEGLEVVGRLFDGIFKELPVDRAPLGVSLPPVAPPRLGSSLLRAASRLTSRASSQHSPEVARPCTLIWEGHPKCRRHISVPHPLCTLWRRGGLVSSRRGGWGGAALPVRACPTSAKVLSPALSHHGENSKKNR